jgi:DNA-binding response OmpR family regulator
MTRLLMIDDDEKLVSLVKAYLEPQGFEIAAAYDGHAGIQAATKIKPALIILDLMLNRKP